MHLDVESIEILKECSHPFDHDLVISPTLVELLEQWCSIKLFQITLNILLEILSNWFCKLAIEHLLSMLVLDCAKIIHDGIVLHIFFLREHNITVSCLQEVLKLIDGTHLYLEPSFLDNFEEVVLLTLARHLTEWGSVLLHWRH